MFGRMNNITYIELSHNNLEGFIPNSICNVMDNDNLVQFYVAHNSLCEPPPPDCITGDDIQFNTQEYNEDCYTSIVEIPGVR